MCQMDIYCTVCFTLNVPRKAPAGAVANKRRRVGKKNNDGLRRTLLTDPGDFSTATRYGANLFARRGIASRAPEFQFS